MTAEFEVRLTESTGASMLTPFIPRDSLSFRSAEHGYDAITFDLSRKIDARDFEDFAPVTVFDAATGETACEGRLLNPGRGLDTNGETWKLAALGPAGHLLQEVNTPYHLIDSRIEDGPWWTGFRSSKRFTFDPEAHPDNADLAGWLFKAEVGMTWAATTDASINYYDMEQYGLANDQRIGGFYIAHDMGRSTTNQRLRGILSSYNGSDAGDVMDVSWSTTANTRVREVTTDWPATGIGVFSDAAPVRIIIRVTRTGSDGTIVDSDWAHISAMRVSAQRVDRAGADIVASGSYTNNYLLAHEAIIDALARFCPEIDLARARIDETSTHEHTSLVWPEGVTVYRVLEELAAKDLGFTWAVWERQTNGLYRFEWRERDTEVRYELTADDGFERSGAQQDALRRVYYTGQTLAGRYRIGSISDAFYDDPDDAVRSTTLNVESRFDDTNFNDEGFSLADKTLLDSKLAASSATLDVRRKVYDHRTGRWVQPWAIVPGYLCRVRGVHAELDALNDGTDSGSSVFRVVSNDYSVGQGAARLELNSYLVDETRAIAELMKARA